MPRWLDSFTFFAGLPWFLQILFWTAFAVTVVQFVLITVLSIRGVRAQRQPVVDRAEAGFLWVFLVPALNEEITIGDTLARLEGVRVTNRRMVVIDDGSTDRTGEILARSPNADLRVLTRTMPNAQKGKAAALNDAWARVRTDLPAEFAQRFGEDRTLVVIVDADGRLDPEFADAVASRFLDPAVGGVQMGVRIYNRTSPLTYMQDVEFLVFGSTYQMGRTDWGTAGMGGNGQINRLSALTEVGEAAIAAGDADGPWRHRLTEDQDLGLSLVGAGWKCEQEMRHAVDQQGLPGYRRLFRQRVRWCQGNMQAIARIGVYRRADVPRTAKLDGSYWLLQPVVQTVIGVSTLTALVLLVFFRDLVQPDWNAWLFLGFLFLGFGGTTVGVIRAELARGSHNILKAMLLIVPYAVYCWLLLPIYPVAWFRQATRRRNWAKTAREAVA